MISRVGIGIAAAGAIALILVVKMIADKGALGAGAAAGKAVGDAAAGLVLGLGDSLGIPHTDESACSSALAEGRIWDASFYCPAGRFLSEGMRSLFNGGSAQPEPAPGGFYAQPEGLRELRRMEAAVYEGPGGAAFGLYPRP